MSDLQRPNAAREWIASWIAHYRDRPDLLAKRLARVAEEQAANLASYQGRHTAEYAESVEILRAAARSAEKGLP